MVNHWEKIGEKRRLELEEATKTALVEKLKEKLRENSGRNWGQPWETPKEKHQDKTSRIFGGRNGRKPEREHREASYTALGESMRAALGSNFLAALGADLRESLGQT